MKKAKGSFFLFFICIYQKKAVILHPISKRSHKVGYFRLLLPTIKKDANGTQRVACCQAYDPLAVI